MYSDSFHHTGHLFIILYRPSDINTYTLIHILLIHASLDISKLNRRVEEDTRMLSRDNQEKAARILWREGTPFD